MSIQVKSKQTGEAVKKETKTPASSGELAAFLKQVEKVAPKVVTKASELAPIQRIPTGIFEFDFATGGGIPRGRISIIYGPESSGKSNALYKAMANAQRLPPPCNKVALVDVEGTFDPVWAAMLGVMVEDLILIKPNHGEQAVDITTGLISIDEIVMVGVDSVAAMISIREAEASTEKADVGTQALLIKRLCNKLILAMSVESRRNHYPSVVLINQTRFKIGVMFGDPETMPGGNTLKFSSSLTVRLYGKNEMVKEISSEVPVFKKTTMVIKKAKVPILQADTTYSLCMLPHDVLKAGDSASWNMVMAHLKNLGHLVPAANGKGWDCNGENFKTLKEVSMRYYTELDYRLLLQRQVVEGNAGSAMLIGQTHDDNVAKEDIEDKL